MLMASLTIIERELSSALQFCSTLLSFVASLSILLVLVHIPWSGLGGYVASKTRPFSVTKVAFFQPGRITMVTYAEQMT